jgi:hypothetical protein
MHEILNSQQAAGVAQVTEKKFKRLEIVLEGFK